MSKRLLATRYNQRNTATHKDIPFLLWRQCLEDKLVRRGLPKLPERAAKKAYDAGQSLLQEANEVEARVKKIRAAYVRLGSFRADRKVA